MEKSIFRTELGTQGQAVVLGMHGELNAFAEDSLHTAFEQAEKLNPHTVTLDFTDVDYINSTGIALIVGLLSIARRHNLTMSVFGLSDHYREIFQVTRLSDFIQIYPDRASALAGSVQA